MSIAVTDPLHTLSLARTALSDPAALPSNSDFDPDLSMAGETADPTHVAYAIEQIDRAIGSLCFEPFDDPAGEAGVALANGTRRPRKLKPAGSAAYGNVGSPLRLEHVERREAELRTSSSRTHQILSRIAPVEVRNSAQ